MNMDLLSIKLMNNVTTKQFMLLPLLGNYNCFADTEVY